MGGNEKIVRRFAEVLRRKKSFEAKDVTNKIPRDELDQRKRPSLTLSGAKKENQPSDST